MGAMPTSETTVVSCAFEQNLQISKSVDQYMSHQMLNAWLSLESLSR